MASTVLELALHRTAISQAGAQAERLGHRAHVRRHPEMAFRPAHLDCGSALPGVDPPLVLLPALGSGHVPAQPVAGTRELPCRLEVPIVRRHARLPDGSRFEGARRMLAVRIEKVRVSSLPGEQHHRQEEREHDKYLVREDVLGPFVHRIDPILGSIGGIHLWWYGLSYAAGFLQILLYLRRARHRLGMTSNEVYALALCIAIGVLAGGRAVEVAFDEWPFYREHPLLIPAYWLGGMATHGLLIGAAAGAIVFSVSLPETAAGNRRRAGDPRSVPHGHRSDRQLHRRTDRRRG